MLKKLWYNSVVLYLKNGLFFYSKKILVSGKENIPKKGAVLFCVNHPNGLIDPLIVTTNTSRNDHYLVRAASFKKPFIKKILESLNLMPIYRIRDGANQLGKNKEIFENCANLFKRGESLMIFPEGSHNSKRTVRPLSKGFTRIIFGTLEQNPELKIKIIPVGLTYQNASFYPTKVTLNFGKPIAAEKFYNTDEPVSSVNNLKNEVRNQLKKLSVHIPDDEKYASTLAKLDSLNVDFTKVDLVNKMIETGNYPEQKKKHRNFLKPLYYIIILNSLFPFLIWKKVSKKIDEIEFVDTFRFTFCLFAFPVFYGLQAWVINLLFDWKVAICYALTSLFLIVVYSKFSVTNTKNSI
jgi:1-acyl-sn-glycerol-3-phosphate acyltransferase